MSLPIETVLSLLEAYPYLLLFPLVLLEGPIVTVAAGLLVAAGLIGWPVAYAVAVTADLTGDTLYYLLGRSARHPRAGRLLARLGLTEEKLAAMGASFGRNEGKALVGAKRSMLSTSSGVGPNPSSPGGVRSPMPTIAPPPPWRDRSFPAPMMPQARNVRHLLRGSLPGELRRTPSGRSPENPGSQKRANRMPARRVP